MRSRLVLLVALGTFASAAATLGADAVCTDDSQCPQGQYCYGGNCLTGSASPCTLNADCPQDEFCAGATSSTPGRCLIGCRIHCECPQGLFCFKGTCTAALTVYCCDKPGCPPGRWCVNGTGDLGFCPEDPNYSCQSACDCGPAHCCKDGVCVKDVDDPLFPGGTAILELACEAGVDATYCCDYGCFTGQEKYGCPGPGGAQFRCYNRFTGVVDTTCGGRSCFARGDCPIGDVCIGDTSCGAFVGACALSCASPPAGTSCNPQGGRCAGGTEAELYFGWSSLDTGAGSACGAGSLPGEKCQAGWRPGGAYAVQPVMATWIGNYGSCGQGGAGDGTCQAWETAITCPADCSCGDGICDTTEVDSCTADCGTCGDGVCKPSETPKNCPADCPATCGDGSCDASEVMSCPQDCGCPASPGYADAAIWCGDGLCQAAGDIPETWLNCPKDCPTAPPDSDGDGIVDPIDQCVDDALNDADGDGVCGGLDNCATWFNPNQAAHDGDGRGDACDTDDDGDGVADASDNCPFAPNADQADFDGDGAGNACDTDSDNDGLLDAQDQCLQTPPGSIVGPDGCSVAQSCPCGNEWKNRGAYVSCVAHASESLLGLGLIDEAAKNALVSDAAESDCGR